MSDSDNNAPLIFTAEEQDRLAATVAGDVLRGAYWELRDHAAGYRNAELFRRTYNAWQANRDDPRAYRRHIIHEFFARGIEAAAQDLAESLAKILGIPESVLDPPVPARPTARPASYLVEGLQPHTFRNDGSDPNQNACTWRAQGAAGEIVCGYAANAQIHRHMSRRGKNGEPAPYAPEHQGGTK